MRQRGCFPSAVVEKMKPCNICCFCDPLMVQSWVLSNCDPEHSKSCALLGKLAGFLLWAQQRCRWHSCRVRAHQQTWHMVQINHLSFRAVQQRAGNCCGSDWLVSCCRASWSLSSCHIAGLIRRAQQKTSSVLSVRSLLGFKGSRTGKYWLNPGYF